MGSIPITLTTNMLNTEKLDTRFRNLFKSGKLVQVHVSKWSMSTSVEPKD